MAIARNALARLRTAVEMDLRAGAEKIGISRQYLSSVECGESVPSVIVLRAMAMAYRVPIETVRLALLESWDTGKAAGRIAELREMTGPYADLKKSP